MAKVVVTDHPFESLDIESRILGPLQCELVACTKAPPPSELARRVADADAVMTVFATLDAAAIAAMQRARVIVRYGVGVDNVDLEAAKSCGIPVCNVPDYCTDEVADHTLALILAATRQVLLHAEALRTGKWGLATPVASLKTLSELTVGVIGLGRIGREVVRRLKGFKCRLLAYDPALSSEQIRAQGCEPAGFDEVLPESDVLTLHCPASPDTQKVINRESILRMKAGAILINASRGTLVDTPALVEALQTGHLAAAGLDVFDPEPLPGDSPLRQSNQVVASPHIAAVSAKSIRTLRETAAEIVALALGGRPLPNVVNGVRGKAPP